MDAANGSTGSDGPTAPTIPSALDGVPGATSSNTRVIPTTFKLPRGLAQLDGSTNWDTWSFRLQNVFEAEDVWGLVIGTDRPPSDATKLAEWNAKDKAARITINLAISSTCIPLVINAQTAAAAWKALSDAYKTKGLLTAFYHRSQLLSFRFNETLPFGPQIDHLRQLRVKQTSAGMPCEDWDFAICLLAALPESYSVIKQSILAGQTDLKKLDLGGIVGLISQEEIERKGFSHGVDPEVAFATRHGQRQPPKPQPPKDKKKTGICNWCKREGHWESDCRKKKDSQAQAQIGSDKSNLRRDDKKNKNGKGGAPPTDTRGWVAKLAEDDVVSEEAKATLDHNPKGDWWEFDSGATRVFHGNIEAFSDYKPFDSPLAIGLASSQASTNALGSGTLTINFFPSDSPPVPVRISNAFHAPGIMNLISISHLDDLGRRVQFADKRIHIWNGDELELSVPRIGNSYRVRGEVVFPEKAQVGKVEHDSWHRRWGHLAISSIQDIARKDLVTDLDIDVKVSGSAIACDACLRGKHTRSPFPTGGRTRAKNPLELVHSDICGPFPVTREGYKYYLTLLDDYTEYAVVYRLKAKSDAADSFKDYHVRSEKHTGHVLKAIQTDNGGEFEGEFEKYCTQHGIHHRRTTSYTPEQNGVAERLNRTLNNSIVSCLIAANLGDSYWGDALLYATYTRNRSPSRAIPGFVPYTLWNNGSKPSVAHLRPFGCTAYVHVPKKVRQGKLAPKSNKLMFVGYDANRKAWRCYDPVSRKEQSSRDVTFLEALPFTSSKEELTFVNSISTIDDDSDSESTDDEHATVPISISTPTSSTSSASSPSVPTPNPATPSSAPPDTPAQPQQPPSKPPRKRRNVLQQFPIMETRLRQNVAPPEQFVAGDYSHSARMAYEFSLAATDPRSYKEALSGPDSKQWEESIQSEFQSLVDTGTFEVVDLPPGRKAIPSTYVFKEKTGPDGRTIKFKTRIVARGDLQQKGIDYNQVFAPVPRLDTVRAVFSYAASQDWDIDQIDFKSAFLNGDLKEEVYMKPPQGFATEDGKVWRLRKTLYGLRQAPSCWHDKLTTTLKEFTLVRSSADFSVYIGRFGNDIIIILTHVDDMAITGNNRKKLDEIKAFIKTRFEVEDLGQLHFYLAIEWNRDRARRTITAHQGKFARTILERFYMLDCRPEDTPVVANYQFSLVDSPAPNSADHAKMSKVPYLEAIGSLMYLMLGTRPDLAYAIGKLSRFGSNPGQKHWKGVKRTLQYLKGTIDHALTLGGISTGKPILFAYSDASFQDCPDTSRSTSGYVFYLGDGPISWSSKTQDVVTNSTMEAEYLGLSNAARQAIWLRELLEDLDCVQTDPTTLYNDNNAALILAQDVHDHSRAKHIKRTYHYVRERILQFNDVTVEYCPSKENIADVFTKPLGSDTFSTFTSQLITNVSTPTRVGVL